MKRNELKRIKREEAEQRQENYSKLTREQKIAKLDPNGSMKQRKRFGLI